MFVRFLCDWPPYKDGQCLEVNDRFGSHFVARCMAEKVTGADATSYAATMETIDRAIEKRINAMPVGASRMPARGGRRTITEDQWRRELGQKGPAPFRRIPATLTVRS